ncbi:hypothetical protein MPTK1_4g03980 [Marchantia polymorpha subsp. ruderalis]|uniref:Uncharacterized protein n=2 Tax=Marchantia polymorpha TaxID=3197 RepID=A0AAF6B632_MARPO|nr:hypothetical protein MARPO_0044s0076 [Marchantia polymorpha]BBN07466.1 hypothetical protein Mp_4g03980 [Marchantia polymorpha subsp. ruderalis]|eukprot:PTQ39635.1 hypothetical protein MARPO_0044s0076 [Marchantia polymorpha]
MKSSSSHMRTSRYQMIYCRGGTRFCQWGPEIGRELEICTATFVGVPAGLYLKFDRDTLSRLNFSSTHASSLIAILNLITMQQLGSQKLSGMYIESVMVGYASLLRPSRNTCSSVFRATSYST